MIKYRIAAICLTLLAPSGVGAQEASRFDWSGFYVGAQVGAEGLSGELRSLSYCVGSGICVSDYSATQVLAGGLIGYSMQLDSVLVGIEADANGKFGSASSLLQGFNAYQGDWVTESAWDASVRAKVGLLVSDNLLVFATGGLSVAELDLRNSNCPGCAEWGTTNLHGGVRTGWALGGGAEVAISENLRLRAHYQHSDFGTVNVASPVAGNVYSSELSTNAVTVGALTSF